MSPADRLCFGTSTFAAGRLRPSKDSGPGIATLAAALAAGVRLIHSNPNLETQWAIRQAVESAGNPAGVRHLVKVELPADASAAAAASLAEAAVTRSRQALDVGALHAAVIEIDLKRTSDRRVLVDIPAIAGFYQMAAQICADLDVERSFGYCHSPAHLAACVRAEGIGGYAAQYNQVEAWPALYLDRLATTGRPFIGMAPLRRGALVNPDAIDPAERLRALRWALGHPAVHCVAVTLSTPQHLAEVLAAAEKPLLSADIHHHAQARRASAASSRRPEVIIP